MAAQCCQPEAMRTAWMPGRGREGPEAPDLPSPGKPGPQEYRCPAPSRPRVKEPPHASSAAWRRGT